MYGDTILKHPLATCFQPIDRIFQLHHQPDEDIAHLAGMLARILKVIENDTAGRGINSVYHIIESRSESMDIFPIDRSNEGLVQASDNVVSQLVANVFELFDLVRILNPIIEIIEQFLLYLRSLAEVRCKPIEEVVILLFLGHQAKHN
jgi:hypothetical protein